MLALTVDLLVGRYYACAYNDRTRPEWPPHPARLFSALVAALPGPGEEEDYDAEAALRWLEEHPAPGIAASSCSARDALDVFVPVNDVAVVKFNDDLFDKVADAEAELAAAASAKDRAAADKRVAKARQALASESAKAIAPPTKADKNALSLVDARFERSGLRQRRYFPSVTPETPRVSFVWRDEPPAELVTALDRLAARVSRLGHSASLVSVRVDDAPAPPTLLPAESGDMLRVPGPGQLAALRAAFAIHRETEPRVLPCAFQAYAPARAPSPPAPAAGEFGDDWIVLRRVDGPRPPLTAIESLARQLRRALMAHAPSPTPAVISGHTPEGAPTRDTHLAVVPLPFVDHKHADGAVLGFALVLPRRCAAADRAAVLAAIGEWEERGGHEQDEQGLPPVPLHLGRGGVLSLERLVEPAALATLQPERWCRPAKAWATVTPIALDRNPGDLSSRDPVKAASAAEAAARIIADAVTRQGLPRPVRVEVQDSPPFAGSAPVRSFPAFPVDPRRTRRVKVHAHIVFEVPIAGPLLLGAGRFFGLGLCRPISEGR